MCKQELPDTEFYECDKAYVNHVCKCCRSKRSRHNRTMKMEKNIDLFRQKNSESMNKWKIKNPIYYWIHQSRDKHKRNGFDVRFTTKELFEKIKGVTHCPYCGIELDFRPTRDKELCHRPTLDRINNENIMTLDNVQVLCYNCNTSKGSMPHDEFMNFIKRIAEKCCL